MRRHLHHIRGGKLLMKSAICVSNDGPTRTPRRATSAAAAAAAAVTTTSSSGKGSSNSRRSCRSCRGKHVLELASTRPDADRCWSRDFTRQSQILRGRNSGEATIRCQTSSWEEVNYSQRATCHAHTSLHEIRNSTAINLF